MSELVHTADAHHSAQIFEFMEKYKYELVKHMFNKSNKILTANIK